MLVASVLGAALFSFPIAGIVGVALSIGFSVMAMIFAVGAISGGHYQSRRDPRPRGRRALPGQRRPATTSPPSASAASPPRVVFYLIASGKSGGFEVGTSPPICMAARRLLDAVGLLIESVLTGFLIFVIMGVTSDRAPAGFAAIAIGLTLSAIHIMAIPVDNASVNPARSLATAFIALGEPLAQLWLFWVAPILGGVAGGLLGRWLHRRQ